VEIVGRGKMGLSKEKNKRKKGKKYFWEELD
jgi:hypothetical protein